MARKTKEDSEKTRVGILDAAEILFYEKGVSSTSLEDIAAAAGVSRGAIYWHFKNKVDLFDAMHSRIALPLEDLKAETMSQPDPIAALMDYWIRAFSQLASDDQRRRVIEILMRKCEYVEEFQEAEVRIREWSDSLLEIMSAIFADAQRKSLMSKDMSPETVAILVDSAIAGLFHMWMLRKSSFDIEKHAPNVIALLFESLRHC
jgi:AcrR family transcriptional regulator